MTALSMNGEPMVKVGRIGAAWGIRGFVKIQSYTDPVANIFEHPDWTLYQNGQWRSIIIDDHQIHSKGLVARFKDIHDRNDVEQFIHAEIYIPRTALPECSEHEYYWLDLVGLKVLDCEQKLLGHVDYLYETPAHDNMLVRADKKRIHIPFIQDQFVKKVDLTTKTIVVDWQESI